MRFTCLGGVSESPDALERLLCELDDMSRSTSTFRQSDLTRAIRGVRNAGVDVARAEIAKDGKIIIVVGEAGNVSSNAELTPDDELERWRRRKNAD